MVKKIPFNIFSFNLLLALIASAIFSTPAFADSGSTNPTPPASGSGSTRASHSSSNNNLSDVPSGTKVVIVDSNGDKVPLGSQAAQDILASGDPQWCPTGVTPGSLSCTSNTSLSALVAGFTPSANGVIWIEEGPIADSGTAVALSGSGTWSADAGFTLTLQGGWTGSGTMIDQLQPSVFNNSISIINWNNNITVSDILISGATGPGLTVRTSKNITLTRVQSNNNTLSGAGADLETLSGSAGTVTVTSSQFNNNGGDGLDILSKGAITLTNVTANNNTNGYGAYVDNHTANSAMSVTLSGDNTFNNNKFDGLVIDSIGAVTVNDVTATGSLQDYGVSIDNCYLSLFITNVCGGTGAVKLTGTNIFTENLSGGLYVTSNGAISANNLIANSNQGSGADGVSLDNHQASAPQSVTLTGTSLFKYNNWSGLVVDSKGQITVNNITASYNKQNIGADLENPSGSSGVTLTGTNVFNGNYNTGLWVSTKGAITLNNITADCNGYQPDCVTPLGSGYGVYVENTGGTKAVTLTGINTMSNNYGDDGLYVTSNGAVKLSSVTASNNYNGDGVDISNCDSNGTKCLSSSAVTLSGTGVFNFNSNDGISVYSGGAITLNNVTANNNIAYGADLQNSSAGGVQPVTLTGTNVFDNNSYMGLYAATKGAVKLNNLTANCDGTNGTNCTGGTGGYGVYVDTCAWNSTTDFCDGVGAVTLTGTNIMNNDYYYGLYVNSKGAVTLNNVTADNSLHSDGAYIDNCQWNTYHGTPACAGSGAVTLAGTNTFNNNFYTGISVFSNGAIKINNLTANNNIEDGADLENYDAKVIETVTLTDTNTFDNNNYIGMNVDSNGAIKLNSVTANCDGTASNCTGGTSGYGLWLDNTYGAGGVPNIGTAAVSLTGTNVLNGNYYSGLYLNTHGAVTFNNLTANDNQGGDGIYVYLSGNQAFTLTGTNVFDSNYGDGLYVYTSGKISVNNVTASDNGHSNIGEGVVLYNTAGSPADVILTGANVFTGNHSDGLDIGSLGNITLNSLTANSNGAEGVSIDNCQYDPITLHTCTGTGVMTLTGTNTFDNNLSTGLDAQSGHTIKVNNATADCNGYSGNCVTGAGGNGVTLDNSEAVNPQPVTLTGTNTFNGNYDDGLQINSLGTITGSNLNASNNAHGSGLDLSNHFGLTTSTAGITLSGASIFNDNYYYGLDAASYGAISINTTSINAVGNGTSGFDGYGAYLDNSGSTASTNPAVILKGTNTLNGNYEGGLYAASTGTITLNNITADSNSEGYGATITNSTNGKGVTLTGTNVFDNNYLDGLNINIKGAVLLNNITANCNGYNLGCSGTGTGSTGLVVDNSTASPAQTVTLTGVNNFNNNNEDGLDITSAGAISASNVTASYNGGNGMLLDNHTGSAGVTLTGVNNVIGDSSSLGSNVDIHTAGAVNLTDLTSDGSGGTGLVVEATATNVTLTCGSFTNNAGNGVNVTASGTLTMIGVVASGNGATDISPTPWDVVVRNCP